MTQKTAKRTGFALGVAIPAVIIAVILLLTSGGGGSARPKRPPPAKLPRLTQVYESRPIGVVGLIPRDWTARRGSGFVRLANTHGTALIVIQAQTNNLGTHALMLSAVATLTKQRPGIKPRIALGDRLGGLPANQRVIYTRDARGVPIRILVVGARGKHVGYVLEAITDRRASLRDLEETQEIVSILRLTG
ncbi:MAG: hypothetical protein ACR2QA_11555 [Solirubrobacteraceae bacterium]